MIDWWLFLYLVVCTIVPMCPCSSKLTLAADHCWFCCLCWGKLGFCAWFWRPTMPCCMFWAPACMLPYTPCCCCCIPIMLLFVAPIPNIWSVSIWDGWLLCGCPPAIPYCIWGIRDCDCIVPGIFAIICEFDDACAAVNIALFTVPANWPKWLRSWVPWFNWLWAMPGCIRPGCICLLWNCCDMTWLYCICCWPGTCSFCWACPCKSCSWGSALYRKVWIE